ncbi:MAG: hypothetical protein QXU69_08930 [Thermofilaceae archaeon]
MPLLRHYEVECTDCSGLLFFDRFVFKNDLQYALVHCIQCRKQLLVDPFTMTVERVDP